MSHNSMFCVFQIPDFSKSKESAKIVRIWFSKSKSYAWLIHLKDVFELVFLFLPMIDLLINPFFYLLVFLFHIKRSVSHQIHGKWLVFSPIGRLDIRIGM